MQVEFKYQIGTPIQVSGMQLDATIEECATTESGKKYWCIWLDTMCNVQGRWFFEDMIEAKVKPKPGVVLLDVGDLM